MVIINFVMSGFFEIWNYSNNNDGLKHRMYKDVIKTGGSIEVDLRTVGYDSVTPVILKAYSRLGLIDSDAYGVEEHFNIEVKGGAESVDFDKKPRIGIIEKTPNLLVPDREPQSAVIGDGHGHHFLISIQPGIPSDPHKEVGLIENLIKEKLD